MKNPSIFRFALSAVLALSLSPLCLSQANLVGEWHGTLEANGNKMHVLWHVVAASEGTVTSTFDNVDENISGIKVKSMTLEGSKITLTVDDQVEANGEAINIRGSFSGTVSEDGKEVSGNWTQDEPQQGPLEVHFVRETAAPPAAGSADHPSDPGK
jgi:hypothetical protein